MVTTSLYNLEEGPPLTTKKTQKKDETSTEKMTKEKGTPTKTKQSQKNPSDSLSRSLIESGVEYIKWDRGAQIFIGPQGAMYTVLREIDNSLDIGHQGDILLVGAEELDYPDGPGGYYIFRPYKRMAKTDSLGRVQYKRT
jgi:hypothetical protein